MNSVSHLVFDYQNQIDEDLVIDCFDDMHEGYDVADEEWTSYYNSHDYSDDTWSDLGGVNSYE